MFYIAIIMIGNKVCNFQFEHYIQAQVGHYGSKF